jgi:hypothetical protein
MILEILGSAGFGSAVGGILGYLSKREERANMKMKLNHELDIIHARTQATIEVAKMGIEEAKIAGTLLVDKIEAKAFEVSQKSTSALSDILKSFIRPIILGILLYQTYMILQSLEMLTGGLESFDSVELLSLYKVVILSITGLTSTAVGWYFAARSSKQFDKLLEKWG